MVSGDGVPPFLYGTTFSTAFGIAARGYSSCTDGWMPGMMRLGREEDGSVTLGIGPYPAAEAKLSRSQVAILAGKLVAALDDWPQFG